MVSVRYSDRGDRLMHRVWDDMTLLGRITTMVCIPILLLMAMVWVGDQTRNAPASTASGEDPAAWADRLEAEYLDMVGRDTWQDHCQQDKAEWACETTGMDATNLGLLQVQMNGEYDDPYMQDLAGRAINAVIATLAFYEPTEEHMDWVIAVDHQRRPQAIGCKPFMADRWHGETMSGR